MQDKIKVLLEKISDYFNESSSEFLEALIDSIFFTNEENNNIYLGCNSNFFLKEFKNKLNQTVKNIENTVVFNDFLSEEWKKTFNESKRIQLLNKEETQALKDRLDNLKKRDEYKINDASHGIKKFFSFDNYLTFDFNREAIFIAHKIANKEADYNWNPIVVEGNPGCGKTHLIHAIANERQRLYPEDKICIVSADEFTTEFISALHAPDDPFKIELFKSKYKDYDLFMIDDAQMLASRTKTNEVFFNIFNSIVDQKKTVVLTSDRKIQQLQEKFDARMISRFQKGLEVFIESPNKQDRIQILKQKLKENSLEHYIEDHIIEEISELSEGDIRKIEGSVSKLKFRISYNGSSKTKEEILKEFLENETNNKNLILSKDPKYVFEKIKHHFGIDEETIKSSKRKNDIVQARHICMYVLKNVYNKNLSQIGKLLKKDHTTVKHGIEKIHEEMQTDPVLKDFIENFRK
ncbi:DnaA ATPase domain-containing protein [Mycoplasma sp. E35C]|uniref:DnaA ATPase domain-containing protein n=1 Tax=Mycoplasma sp. E35C TaxID=2801918 RepID=UPI001CA43E04|nr:DnaA/Hda family protein [Mycoplasma sp. E35C]QZX49151.1 ATP-binding protein [Mycoplasma sp. E35C]